MRRLSVVVFPAVLCLAAVFFLFGDLGKWLDDWFYVQRVAETGAIRSLIVDTPVHFWRPGYRVVVPALMTLLWQHDQVHHAIVALGHVWAAAMLWILLRRLGAVRLAASLAALAFATWHPAFEVPLWLCNLPTSIAAAVALLGLVWMCTTPAGPARVALVMAICALASASFNEQPAALTLAAPLVVLAQHGAGRAARNRALAGGVGAALGLGLAIVGHAMFAPGRPSTDPSASFLTPMHLWPEQVSHFVGWTRRWAFSADTYRDAWRLAATSLAEHPWRAAAFSVVLTVSAVPWIGDHARRGHEPVTPSARSHAQRGLRLVGLGLALAMLAALPIISTSYWLNPRVLYAPGIGLAVALAGVITMLASPSATRTRYRVRRGFVATVGAILLSGAACAMIGAQHAMALRARLDEKALDQLRQLAAELEPGAVLVPVQVEPQGRGRIHHQLGSVFGAWWSSEPAIRLAVGRSDIRAGHLARTPLGAMGWSGPTLAGDPVPGGSVVVHGAGRVSWSRVFPFTVDAAHRVHPISRVEWTSPTGAARAVDLPLMVGIRGSTFVFPALPGVGEQGASRRHTQ